MVQLATPTSFLPFNSTSSLTTQEQQQRRRIVVMIHCGPKTVSTTLRHACNINLEHTCGGIKRNTAGYSPVGVHGWNEVNIHSYDNVYTLLCQGGLYNAIVIWYRKYQYYDKVLFIQMFPFHMYDECGQWSALKNNNMMSRGSKRDAKYCQIVIRGM